MIDLTPDEEVALRELQELPNDDAVHDLIEIRLYSPNQDNDDLDQAGFDESDDYVKQRNLYDSLVSKGMLSATPRGTCQYYDGLTPDGRYYFQMKAREKKEKRKERWGQRAFTIGMGIFVFILNLIVTICFK